MLFSEAKMIVEAEVRQHRYSELGNWLFRTCYKHYKLNCDKLRTRNSPKKCHAEERSDEASLPKKRDSSRSLSCRLAPTCFRHER